MRGFFPSSGRVRFGASVGLSVGISLCAGALIAGPLAAPVWAAPTIGGDQNGPQVQIMQPAYQDVLKGKTRILIAVKTQKFNPQFVEMFVDDKPATTGPISVSALPSAQYDWDTKLFADGPHKLMVRITDTQGFRGWAEVTVFINNQKKIDTTPPSLKWQNTKSFQQLSGTTSIQLDALDNFGVKWLFISLSKAGEPSTKLRSWMLNRPPYTVKLDTTQVPDGVYQLNAKAYDSFEQEGEAPSLTLGIVNSAINATTIGDMLAGLQRVEQSNQPATAPPRKGHRFTLDAPGTESNDNANPNLFTAPPAQTTPRTSPRIATAPRMVKPRVLAPTRNSSSNGLSPSLPPMIVRNLPMVTPKLEAQTKTQLAQLAAPEAAPAEVTAPKMSDQSVMQSRRSTSLLDNEINGAMTEDWRARFARAGAPEMAPRSLSGEQNAPMLSDHTGADESRRVALAPFRVKAEGGALQGRLSAPQAPARPDDFDASMPQISAPSSAERTKISPRETVSAKLDALQIARAAKNAVTGKAASPALHASKTRIAALPRPTKNDARGSITAITVSPLEVQVSGALPAFHVTTRNSSVRAVAARYGLPVEVVAANNGWKADRILVAGEHVKLPKQLKVAYHGIPVTGDAPSMLVGGVGVTAFRFMFEQAGGKLTWDAKRQRVTAHKGNSEVVLSIGSNHAKVGDKDVMLELAAFLFEGRTMVPVRFFEEGLHAQVEWDPQTGRLVVAMAN